MQQVAEWMVVPEAAAEHISKAVTDAAKLVQAVLAAEAQLTVETFTDAATRIYKFLQAKAHRVIKDELTEGVLSCIRASLQMQGSHHPFHFILQPIF